MWRDGRPSVSRNCGCRSFAGARPRSSSLRVRKGDRQSRAFDPLAVSIRKIADGRAAVDLFAGNFRFSQTLRRKFFAVPINLPKVQTDRKSTRLNSSHSQISYAVFCLKEKKKKQSNYTIPTYLH